MKVHVFGTWQLPTWNLDISADMYQRRADGSLQFNGRRPGPDWHAHGYFKKGLLFWEGERLVLKQVHKRRWRQIGTHQTCHSRPVHDPPYIRVSTPLIVLVLCLTVAISVICDANEEVQMCRSPRTVQRWCARARTVALYLQHAIRAALIEICEPRPVERLFEGGLSPPCPKSPPKPFTTSDDLQLRRGLWMAVAGAVRLVIPLSNLLAEARGRWTGPKSTFPL